MFQQQSWLTLLKIQTKIIKISLQEYPPWNERDIAPENRSLEKEIPIGNHHF